MELNGRLGTVPAVSLGDCVRWAQQQVGGMNRVTRANEVRGKRLLGTELDTTQGGKAPHSEQRLCSTCLALALFVEVIPHSCPGTKFPRGSFGWAGTLGSPHTGGQSGDARPHSKEATFV